MSFLVEKIRTWLAVVLCNALWVPILISAAFLLTKKYLRKFNLTESLPCMKRSHSNENLELLNGQDLLWIEDSNRNRLYYSYLVSVSEWIDIEIIRERIQIELLQAVDEYGNLLYPKLTKYVVNRHEKWYWKTDDNFCVERNIVQYEEVSGEVALKEAVNQIVGISFVNNKPQWMITSIPYSDADGVRKTILVFRFHHCIGDQFNIQKMVAVSLSDGVYNLNAMTPLEKAKSLSMWLKAYSMFKVLFMYPFRVVIECMRREETPLTLVYLEKKKIYTWSPKINLNLLKTIKSTSKTSINCVLVTCLIEAFKRYFRRCGITDNCGVLTASLLFPSQNELELCSLENQISVQLVKMVMDKPNRLETLRATKENVAFSQIYAKNVFHYLVTNVLMKCFPIDLINWALDRVECSLILMNVPIVADDVTLFEKPVDDIILLNPYRGTAGTSLTFVTYKDSLRVGITINSGIVPTISELDQILLDYSDEVRKLAEDLGINRS